MSDEATSGVVGQVQAAAGVRTPQDAELAAMKKLDAILGALEPRAASRVLDWAASRAQERLHAFLQEQSKSQRAEIGSARGQTTFQGATVRHNETY